MSESLTTLAHTAQPILAELRARGLIDAAGEWRIARAMADEPRGIVETVIGLGLASEDAVADVAGAAFGLTRLSAETVETLRLDGETVSRRFQEAARAAVCRDTDGRLCVVISDPTDTETLDALSFALKRPVQPAIATHGEILALLRTADSETGAEDDGALGGAETALDLERLRESASDAPVIRLVNDLIAGSVDAGASDIHLEPGEAWFVVRQRVDGALREIQRLPLGMAPAIVSRIKIMAALDIGERRLPQDGAITSQVRGRQVDLRVATAPSVRGEAIVIRILNRARVRLDFEHLGFDADLVAELDTVLQRPNGIFLVTGPTGSGKSTTLYAALQKLNTGAMKIITVEDPVEFKLDGVLQIQTQAEIGLTFARALRAMLRHDPNIVMIGEIRDAESAHIAVQAALAGRLVLASLHTNSAAGAVVRLLDMGIEDYLIASTLTAVLAQRLVRTFCRHCKTQDAAGAWSAPGCRQCSGSGYAGRMPIAELLIVSEAQRKLISAKAESATLHAQARSDGMTDLDARAEALVLRGVTSRGEIRRVVADD